LIELLIVVAIIAILAAIAVPNFLEAQVRAKVSRASSDLRTIATALETYRLDYSEYPFNDGVYNVIPPQLTTPIGYLRNARLVDPFSDKERHPVYGDLARYYTYQKIVDLDTFVRDAQLGYLPPLEAVDLPTLNDGALRKYGPWRLVSNGPDRVYSYATDPQFAAEHPELVAADPIVQGSDIPYDPTNGTVSWGNILRTQRSTSGEIQ
jgi:type II secretory pathway pseudopilin PulG